MPRVEPLAIVVLVATVAVLLGVAVLCTVALFLWWAVSKLRPVDEMQADVSGLRALVEGLESQVNKLRTSKAGRISNAKRQKVEEEEPEPDPLLDGLSAEERALFQ